MNNNQGFCFERTKTNPREKAFADLWEHENNNPLTHATNYGHGVLQDLFCQQEEPRVLLAHPHTITHVITDEERYVAATVVQWLGTNCGFTFLEQALRNCGYRIVQDRPVANPRKYDDLMGPIDCMD